MASRSPARRHEQLEVSEQFHGKCTVVSYTPKAGLSFVKWQEAGVMLGAVSRSMQWWVADWVLWGEDTYGEKYTQALEATGKDEKTLLVWTRVAKAVPVERRREELTFSHHEAVSGLDADEQSYWLQKAIDGDTLPNGEKEVWSSRRLRAEIGKLGLQDEDVDVEIAVEDKTQVPYDYLTVDVKQVREAWKLGKREIPGLKLTPPAAVQKEMPA